jgi:hypothetical protein
MLPTDFTEGQAPAEPPADEPSAAPVSKKGRKAKKAAKKAAAPGTRYPSDPQYDDPEYGQAEVALQAMSYADEAMSDEVSDLARNRIPSS